MDQIQLREDLQWYGIPTAVGIAACIGAFFLILCVCVYKIRKHEKQLETNLNMAFHDHVDQEGLDKEDRMRWFKPITVPLRSAYQGAHFKYDNIRQSLKGKSPNFINHLSPGYPGWQDQTVDEVMANHPNRPPRRFKWKNPLLRNQEHKFPRERDGKVEFTEMY